MIVKFFKHGKECGSKPMDYFLGEERDREHARVISGDPVITEHLIDATKYQSKYKSGVLSFTERADELTEQQKLDIMSEFEQTLFPGLERDQYDILWIEHADKDIDEAKPIGRLELNFVIPCQELRSGDRLQPFYAATDLKRVNAWKDLINIKTKTIKGEPITDPNAPNRKRLFNPFLNYKGTAQRPTPYSVERKNNEDIELDTSSRDALRVSIEKHLYAQYENKKLKNRKQVIDELDKKLDLIIERTVKDNITVSHPNLLDKNGKPQRVRLIGDIYSEYFDANNYKPAVQTDYASDEVKRWLRAQGFYKKGIEIKTEQNKELYKDAIAPSLLDIAVKPIIAETVSQRTETLSEAHNVAKKTTYRP